MVADFRREDRDLFGHPSDVDLEDREPWLSPDGWACTRGCPDDTCRMSGTCAWPPSARCDIGEAPY